MLSNLRFNRYPKNIGRTLFDESFYRKHISNKLRASDSYFGSESNSFIPNRLRHSRNSLDDVCFQANIPSLKEPLWRWRPRSLVHAVSAACQSLSSPFTSMMTFFFSTLKRFLSSISMLFTAL